MDMVKGVFLSLFLFFFGCVSPSNVGEPKIDGSPVRLDSSDLMIDFKRDYVNMSGSSVGLSDIVRYLSFNGVRLAYDESLESKKVNIDINEKYNIVELMRFLEVKYNCKAVKNGDIWVLSPAGGGSSSVVAPSLQSNSNPSSNVQEGAYVFYFRMFGFTSAEVSERLAEFSVRRLGNSLYYARLDIARVLQMEDMIKKMYSSLPCQYYFNVWFVSDDVVRDVGLTITPELRGSVGRQFGRGLDMPYDYSAVFTAVMASSFEMSMKRGVRRMGGVVREGSEFVFRIGDSVPMAKRSVSDSGTVTDTGYEYQEFGFSVRVKVEGRAFGVCDLEIDNTDLGGYVNGYPIRHGSNLKTQLSIGDNSRLYVGSCLMDSDLKGFFSIRKQRQLYHVFLQCDLIESGQKVVSSWFDEKK